MQNHILCVGVPLVGLLRISPFSVVIVVITLLISVLLFPALLGGLYLDDG